ncbi:MAG: ester cyclase [Sneathiellaceae bacterium]
MALSDLPGRLYAAYNRHDPGAVAELYDIDAVHREIAQDRARTGREAIADGLARFFEWFPDAHWAGRAAVDDGRGGIAIPYLLTATLQRQMGPFAPQGQAVALKGLHLLRVERGVIQCSEDYWDAATFQRQLATTNGKNGETS